MERIGSLIPSEPLVAMTAGPASFYENARTTFLKIFALAHCSVHVLRFRTRALVPSHATRCRSWSCCSRAVLCNLAAASEAVLQLHACSEHDRTQPMQAFLELLPRQRRGCNGRVAGAAVRDPPVRHMFGVHVWRDRHGALRALPLQ